MHYYNDNLENTKDILVYKQYTSLIHIQFHHLHKKEEEEKEPEE